MLFAFPPFKFGPYCNYDDDYGVIDSNCEDNNCNNDVKPNSTFNAFPAPSKLQLPIKGDDNVLQSSP